MRARDIHWKKLGKDLLQQIRDDHLPNGAAALAFYMVLAIFPAAIFGLSLLPYLPIPNLEQAIMDAVRQALPGRAADMLTSTIDGVLSHRSGGLLSFGFLFTIWSASNGLYAVMQQLNVVYDVAERRPFVKARAIALLLTLSFFVLVVGAFGLIVFGGMLQSYVGDHLGWSAGLRVVFAVLRWIIIVAAVHLAFALVYYLGPNVEQRFVLVTPGSVFATVALLVASFGFKLYVSSFANFDAVYGSLGAVIILLMWLFVAGWVILLGGEINELVQRQTGTPPREGAGGAGALRHRHA